MMSPSFVARTLGANRCVIISLAVVVLVCLSCVLAVASDDDIVLTPWWGLRFSAGEEAEVDCGVYTGGDANALTIDWVDPAGTTLAANSSTRKTVRRRDKNNGSDSVNGAFSVLTMRLTNLTSADQGTYTCHATRTRGNVTDVLSRNITLAVVSPHQQCGFEDKHMCGWESDRAARLQWQRLDGESSVEKATGPRFDHTYGPSKHVGHFLAVDLPGEEAGGKVATTSSLVSPVYEHHNEPHCMQFWFVFDGAGQEVRVELNKTAADNQSADVVVWQSVKATKGEVVRINIPPQSADYQIVFSTKTCREKCSNGVFAVDDIRIWPGNCTDIHETSPDKRRLKVRLVNGNGSVEGRLEVLHDGMWGSVCSRQFGDEEAQVVCRMLGYSSEDAKAKGKASFGAAPDNVAIWLQSLRCEGGELDIASCIIPGEMWGHTDCSHSEDAAVVCAETPAKPSPSPAASATATPPKPIKTTIKPKQKNTSAGTSKTTTPTTTTTKATTSTTTPTVVGKITPSPATQLPANASTTMKGPNKEKNATSNETKLKGSTPSTRLLYPTPKATSPTSNDTEEAPHMIMYEKRSSTGRHTGLVVVVTLVALVGAAILGVFFCKRKKIIKQNAYITFSTPKYRREQLPNNDFNMESPLTLSSNGYTVLA